MRSLDDDSPGPIEPLDSRTASATRQGTPVRDAAVDPHPEDFLPPIGAGEADPHGPDVIAPELHAVQDQRPVKEKAVRPATQQSTDESAHARRQPRS